MGIIRWQITSSTYTPDLPTFYASNNNKVAKIKTCEDGFGRNTYFVYIDDGLRVQTESLSDAINTAERILWKN